MSKKEGLWAFKEKGKKTYSVEQVTDWVSIGINSPINDEEIIIKRSDQRDYYKDKCFAIGRNSHSCNGICTIWTNFW